MTIEIVDCPIENGGSFHSYVSVPEGKNPPYIWHGESQGPEHGDLLGPQQAPASSNRMAPNQVPSSPTARNSVEKRKYLTVQGGSMDFFFWYLTIWFKQCYKNAINPHDLGYKPCNHDSEWPYAHLLTRDMHPKE